MGIKAVIFDMDGVLIDSEPFWQKAQIDTMKSLGVEISVQECEETMGLRIDALVQHWFDNYQWQGPDERTVAQQITAAVAANVLDEGQAKAGVYQALDLIQAQQLKIGLATSSPPILLNAVLKKLEIGHYFHVTHSAEHEAYGKPHPAVYLSTAKQLQVEPNECLAIEDSFNGLLSAKSACMKTVVIPDDAQYDQEKFCIAETKLRSLTELTASSLQ